jgi:hypothetical protein
MNIGFIRICPKQLYRPTVSRIDVQYVKVMTGTTSAFLTAENWKVKSNQSF